jgi:hypothetical protein
MITIKTNNAATPAKIVPVRATGDAVATDAAIRRTPGKYLSSRRTLGRGNPSRRTLGHRFPSRRTFGRYTPSRRTFGRYLP